MFSETNLRTMLELYMIEALSTDSDRSERVDAVQQYVNQLSFAMITSFITVTAPYAIGSNKDPEIIKNKAKEALKSHNEAMLETFDQMYDSLLKDRSKLKKKFDELQDPTN